MTAVAVAGAPLDPQASRLAGTLVGWLETGARPADLFTDEVFLDLSLPHWRVQARGVDAVFAAREESHPYPGAVRVEALDQTGRGFVVQFEERWHAEGQQWYCRELVHCVIESGRVSELAAYCTGDWDAAVQQRHAEQVRLLRP